MTDRGRSGDDVRRDDAASRRLLIHSILIFVLSFLVSTMVHEGAHAVTARALGVHPILHHNYVSTPESHEIDAAVAIPASGPLISLAQGILFLGLARRRTVPSLTSLTFLWLALHGWITFLGYVMLGPIAAYGDTGRVFALLGVPGWLQWTMAGGALVVLFPVVGGTAKDFARHALPTDLPPREARTRSARRLIAVPVLAGAALTTLLSLPVPTTLSLMHPLTSPFAVFLAYGRMRRSTARFPTGADYPDRVSRPLVLAVAVLVVVWRLLVPGIRV